MHRILITGRGTSGSWKIRGEQLGRAIGADAIPQASIEQLAGREKTIIVKKPLLNIADVQGVRIWDVVDYWPQPDGNSWTRERLIDHVKMTADAMRIDYVVAATEQMRQDIGADFTLYHHYRPNIALNPIRERMSLIGYEGSPKYLGKWLKVIQEECQIRGMGFLVNPANIADVDVIVAFRDSQWKGYATDNWKSNVKLGNAKGSGTPIICNREAGYLETASGGELFADSPQEFIAALNRLEHRSEREYCSKLLRDKAYSVDMAARDYLQWIRSL